MKTADQWLCQIFGELGPTKEGAADVIRAIQADALNAAINNVRKVFPRGSAHTYASENASSYRAQEKACEMCAEAIYPLLPKKR